MNYKKLDLDKYETVESNSIVPETKRKALGITITSLCFAIGISGATIFYDREHSKNIIAMQDVKCSELNYSTNIFDSEYKIIVLKKFVLNNDVWIYQGLVFTSPTQIPIDNATESYVYIGGSKDANDELVVYERQSRKVSFFDDETYSVDSDWSTTGEYIIVNPLRDGYLPPINDIGVRYIYLGTNNEHIHINAHINVDVNGNMYLTDVVLPDSNNIKMKQK